MTINLQKAHLVLNVACLKSSSRCNNYTYAEVNYFPTTYRAIKYKIYIKYQNWYWKKCSDCFNNGCMARLCANLKNDGEKI